MQLGKSIVAIDMRCSISIHAPHANFCIDMYAFWYYYVNNKKRYKLAKNLVDTANEMYMYARMLEKEEDMAQQRLSLERADKIREVKKLREIRGDER